jgi:adenine-specific DNA-methyltransferase
MRYIGNKTRMLDKIDSFMNENNINGKIFCDIFSGTGSVGDFFKDRYQIISNDFLTYSYVFSMAKIRHKKTPKFNKFVNKFGTDPFTYFNNKSVKSEDNFFIHNNFSPKGGRQFLSEENAILIDFIRISLDTFYKAGYFSEDEQLFLLASLLESVMKVSNTSGTYEAFLKVWDKRSLKRMSLEPIELHKESLKSTKNICYSEDANVLLRKVEGDILYIDPPYTITEYSSAYHLLETIARYDYPEIAGKTARRQIDRKMSRYTRKVAALNTFEDLIRQANFEHIVISYSNESIIPLDELTNMLQKYAIDQNVIVKEVGYRQYKNIRESQKSSGLKEVMLYLKKDKFIIKSPLNYSGSKNYLMKDITKILPQHITDFVDVMGGAFNVGANIVSDRLFYNEYHPYVFGIIKYLLSTSREKIVKYSEKIITEFGLNNSLKEQYNNFRDIYNNDQKTKDLFVLTMFCFQNQIRFNNSHKFNTPVGNCGYNETLRQRILGFRPKTKKVYCSNLDFNHYKYNNHDKDTLFYFDPPYIITNATYNDGKRGFKDWTSQQETELLKLLVQLDKDGYKFILSNVIEHKKKVNHLLLDWIDTHRFNTFNVHTTRRKEVLISNYSIEGGSR